MPATYTLSQTTLTNKVGVSDDLILVASVANISPGQCLYITDGGEPLYPGEALPVLGFGSVSGWVKVKRGDLGTAAKPHSSGCQVWIAPKDQLYDYDPVGAPQPAVYVQPWINVLTGGIFWPYGDENDQAARWWQKQTVTHGFGALGVRTTETVGPQ